MCKKENCIHKSDPRRGKNANSCENHLPNFNHVFQYAAAKLSVQLILILSACAPTPPKNLNINPPGFQAHFSSLYLFFWLNWLIRERHGWFPPLYSAHPKFCTPSSSLKCGSSYNQTRPLSSACACHLLSLSAWRLSKGKRDDFFFPCLL